MYRILVSYVHIILLLADNNKLYKLMFMSISEFKKKNNIM